MSAARLLFHQEQTFAGMHRTAVSCQEATYALQQILFDHLGAHEQRERESDAERLGSLEINDQLDLRDSHPFVLTQRQLQLLEPR